MLKFNKLAWRGYGACAVRQFHFGQELSPRGLFPRASAVFLAEADGLEAQSFGCRHSQGQKLLFCLSPTMSVQFLLVEGRALRSNEQRPSRTSAHTDIPNTRPERFSASSGTRVGMLLAMVGATC